MTDSPHMPQEEWSDFAKETGPDTRQPEMVSRQRVLDLVAEFKGLFLNRHAYQMFVDRVREL